MMKANDVALHTRNFYREEDYFTLNVRNGVIRSPTGARVVSIPEDLIIGLHAGLEEETGAAASVVLYACGKWWGKTWYRRHGVEIRQFYQLDVAEMPLHFHQQVLARVWAMHGWGRLEIDFGRRDKGFIEATVTGAMYSEVVGTVGRTTDHLSAGVLSAISTELAGRPVECVETACRSKGDKECRFLIGVKARTDIAEAWVKQGRTRGDVLDAIDKNELA